MKAKEAAYAQALFELARAENQIEQIDRDFGLIAETIGGNLKLKDSLTNPQLKAAQKQAIVGEIFGAEISAPALGFLQLLVSMDRVEYIRLIFEELTNLVQLEERKVVADITTAVALDEAMSDRLAVRLSDLTGKDVKLRPHVDESIVGGIIIRMDGKLLDGSLRSKLNNLKNRMLLGKTRGEG